MQFLLPAVTGGSEKDGVVGHYFTMTINIKEQRFELLDSSTPYGDDVKEYFSDVTSRVRKIWKQTSTELKLSPSNIDHFKKVIVQVPDQGDT